MNGIDKNHVDMTSGPLLKQIIKYCIPIFISGLLMLAFNAADLIIIGQFASKESLAAIGVNSPVIGLLVNLISGLSIGGTVIVSQYFGAHDRRNTSRAVHTIVALSIVCGTAMMIISLISAKPILRTMLPPSVTLDITEIEDNANNDGQAQPGEAVTLHLASYNDAYDALHVNSETSEISVFAEGICSNSVKLADTSSSRISYKALCPGQFIAANNTVTIEIAPSVPTGTVVHICQVLVADNGNSYKSETTFTVTDSGGTAFDEKQQSCENASRQRTEASSVHDKAFTYLWIYCLCLPFCIIYNYAYGILRAVGDTSRPMYYLIYAGIINVVLNVVFVKLFNMDVAGVAIATVISNLFAVVLILSNLHNAHDACRLNFKLLRLHRKYIGVIFRIGIPASLQTSFYSIANIALMSAVAKFGSDALAGNTAACSIEGLLWMTVLAFQQAATSFIGQNYPVGNSERVRKTIKYCIFCVIPLIAAIGWTVFIFGTQITSLYNSSPEVARYACLHMKVSFTLYFIVATLEVVNGALRGFGISFRPAITVFLAICVFRVLWVKFAVPYHYTMDFIYLCYPLSWLLSLIPNSIMLFRSLKRFAPVRLKQ